MMREVAALVILFNLFAFNQSNAQTARVVSGLLRDSSGVGIHGANVQLTAGKDTFFTVSNKDGRYTFKGIKGAGFTLTITSIGYQSYSKNYQFKQDQATMEVELVIMKPEMHQLEDVVVKSVIVPITVKQDTIEYDARAYVIREGDMVEELLKQLPGIEVDKDGNVKAQGKEMTKLRVNGEDFFTNDVTTFIKQLPAHIISKLQVIEDYGEEAEFTGIKKGDPKKMLNLVTKPGMNKGIFGGAGARAATSGTYGLNGSANVWRDKKQISANVNLNNANNNNTLVSTSSGTSLSYRDNWSKKLSVNADYNYNSTRSNYTNNIYRETIYPFGTIYTNTGSTASNKNKGHNLNLGMNYAIARTTYLTLHAGLNYGEGINSSASVSNQTGALRQDLQTAGYSQQSSPNIFASAFFGHRFKKVGRVLSAGVNLNGSNSENTQQLEDHIVYYDANTAAMVKDSLLERLVLTHTRGRIIGMNLTYSEPLSERRRLDVSYSYNSSATGNSLLTNVSRSPGKYDYIDSLSNISQYLFSNHRINLSYRYTSKRLNYSAGINAQPNSTNGQYTGRNESIHYSTLNFSPTANLTFNISKKSTLGMGYNGQSMAPNINQLQPVADSRNLQNIIVGNPNLKPSFSHQYNLSYNRFSEKAGLFSLGLNGSTVKNQAVANVLLIRDSVLGSLKQETHYENANGVYNAGANYNLSKPLFNRKLNVNLGGRISKAKNISYADNVKNYRTSTNISQTLNMGMNLKWLDFSAGLQYSNYKSHYTLQDRTTNVITWNFNLTNTIFFSKTFGIGYDVSKQINSGYYSSISNNPLYINAYTNINLFKKKAGNLRLQLNDLLNQGTSPARYISENSITDSRTNVITRYLLLSFNMRLNKFGKKK